MFDYLSITTFNRCCVECAGVRVRGVHCTSNFSLMISKIEAPAADDAPFLSCYVPGVMYPESFSTIGTLSYRESKLLIALACLC